DDNTSELILQQLQSVAEVARRASVVVYSIDAKGLAPYTPGGDVGGKPSASSYSDAIDSAQAALEGPVFLSNLTGGFTVTNTNDLNIGIQEALYDQQSYYSLGFDPDDEKFDRKFHKIKIRALRPGLSVRTNGGFFGEKEVVEPEQPRTRGQQILAALLSPLGKRDLSLRMTPYFFNASKEGPLVRALFHIDCSKLTFKDGPNGKKVLNLDLAAFAFDEKGATVDMTANRINLEFNEQQYQQVMANGLAYRKDFPLKKSGAYQLRAVLRDDASGRAGTASQFIQVPDLSKGRLGMSGLILTAPKLSAAAMAAKGDAGSTNTVTAASDKPAGEGSQSSALPASPYVRKFARTSWIQYGAAIYNATTDKKNPLPQITVQAEIFRDGKPVYKMPARLLEVTPGTNPKRFDYVGQLRLNNFPEGDYLLHLIVTDGLAKKKLARTEQWMDFSVR
ncbi:MAG: VWA domain-containing protein, partial [Blastocatellia bacterium]